jgi:hypothetical protein
LSAEREPTGDLQREVRAHYLLRDLLLTMAWSPAIALGLMMAIGFPHAQAPASPAAPVLGVLLQGAVVVFLVSPLLSVAGVVGLLRRRRRVRQLADALLGGAIDGGASGETPRRLGGYRVRRQRGTGAIVLQSAPVAPPFRWIANSALIAAAASIVVGMPGGAAFPLAVVFALMAAVAAAVNRWAIMRLSPAKGAVDVRVQRGFGPVGVYTGWRRHVRAEAPVVVLVEPDGSIVLAGAAPGSGHARVPMDALSTGPLGVWEAWVLGRSVGATIACEVPAAPVEPVGPD